MAKKTDHQSKGKINCKTVREQARAILRPARADITGMDKKDLQALVHELEIENQELRVAQVELAQSRDHYSFLYDFAPVGYITVNLEGQILEANLTAAKMLGAARQTLLRDNLSHFVARSGHHDWDRHRQAVFSSEIQQSCELPIQSAGGTLFLHLESVALGNQPDRRCHIVLFDVTGRKQVEQALRESEDRLVSALAGMTRLHQLVTRLLVCTDLSTALEELLDGTIALTGSDIGTIQLLNPQNNTLSIVAQRGFKEDSLEYLRTVTNDDNSVSRRAMKQRQRVIIEDIQTDPWYASHRSISAKAGYRAVQSTPLMSSNRELLGVLSNHYPRPHRPSDHDLRILDLYARQAANFIERQRAAEQLEQQVENRTVELKSAHRQLRALTQRLHDLQEQERAQLARELHDEFGADLTALKIDLHWIMKRLPQKTNNLKQKARAMSELIDKTVDSVRRMATLLRPQLLDDFGLVATMDWQLQDFEKRTGTRVLAYIPEQIDLDKECSTAVFRILQEALTNVARHASATEIVVRLREKDGKILLQIKDNGVGINAKTISNSTSFGLFGMRERAYAFGGVVRIARRRRQGTTVTVEIPLARRAQRHG